MPPDRILLVDDDTRLCALMADYFAEKGLTLEFAHDGGRGLAQAMEGNYDLVILDVMLPVLDGFQVLEQLRRRSTVPILMLTARTEEQDRINGLNAGADDYLPKPFAPDELLARIGAILRRVGRTQVPAVPLEAGGVRLDPQTREVTLGGEPVELTAIEFEILYFLMRSAGRVVSRDEITMILYQRQATPFERALDVHISHIRKKLEMDGPPLISTVRGVGYVFLARAPGPR